MSPSLDLNSTFESAGDITAVFEQVPATMLLHCHVWDLLDTEDHSLALGIHHYHRKDKYLRADVPAPTAVAARRKWAQSRGITWTPLNM